MVEEQNQMVHDLCPQGQSATADGMVRALINIYTDARATQRKSMNQSRGVREGFQEEKLLKLSFKRQVGVSEIHMGNKTLLVDRAA